jgi:hypothetical protein
MLQNELNSLILSELQGPANGPAEEVDEQNIVNRYVLGLISPRRHRNADIELPFDEEFGATDQSESGRDDAIDCVMPDGDDGKPDSVVSTRDSLIPTSIGFSCSVDGNTKSIRVTADWGRYERRESEILTNPKSGKPKLVWKREQMGGTWHEIALIEGPIDEKLPDERAPRVFVKGAVKRYDNVWLVTLFLVNEQEALEPSKTGDRWLFQAGIIAEGLDGTAVFVKRRQRHRLENMDALDTLELSAMDMLYRHRVEFASGHGTSVHADTALGDSTHAFRIRSRAVPEHEVPRTTPRTADDDSALRNLLLDMRDIAAADIQTLISALRPLPDAYRAWIQREALRIESDEDLKEYRSEAAAVVSHCEAACKRIEAGIALLRDDETARDAFRFTNRVMHQQRVRSIYTRHVRRKEAVTFEEVDTTKNRSWYPFQLAFVLMNLPSLTDVHHTERSGAAAQADLLWFPTGGGKTEAYLGLAAYTMAMRRLQGVVDGHDGMHGVAVLMRYTLRVLTLQQFQRAAALICACEIERRQSVQRGDFRWGSEPFRLGLWVGGRTTPNTIADADEAIRQSHGTRNWQDGAVGAGSPHQITNCPWCGHAINEGRDIVVESFSRGRSRVLVYCGDSTGTCPFSRRMSSGEGIPILTVDEEIYRRLPAMLIATVDKFAQMPWNGKVQMLFGKVDGFCPRHGFTSPEIEDASTHRVAGALPAVAKKPHAPLRPPDLIIQDELHLISGPLGTLTGLYETAVDELCSWEAHGKPVRPRIIASTATVRRAGEQVQRVFARGLSIFPPHGIDVEDNFFALQRTPDGDNPGRLYIGICAPGFRIKAIMIRLYIAILAAAEKLYLEHGAAMDPWMTLVGYFNSLRELGGMKRVVDDDIQARLWRMDEHGLAQRKQPKTRELTSRLDATQIPAILDDMDVTFDPIKEAENKVAYAATGRTLHPRPIDVLLATNMISVGVDIGRLGLMVVDGQPKTTAEYIQATSRVGRGAPGLVFTVYNWSRPRDLSHYETFEHYHATFYKHVEALSVTPFSDRALGRGLSAVLASLIRLSDSLYNENASAGVLDKNHPVVKHALDTIRRRAAALTDQETVDTVEKMLMKRLDHWLEEAEIKHASGAALGYHAAQDGRTLNLLHRPQAGMRELFACLNSLRDVEDSVPLILHTVENRGGQTE